MFVADFLHSLSKYRGFKLYKVILTLALTTMSAHQLQAGQSRYQLIRVMSYSAGDMLLTSSGQLLYAVGDGGPFVTIIPQRCWSGASSTQVFMRSRHFLEDTEAILAARTLQAVLPQSVALAKRLAGRKVPYSVRRCNHKHYMDHLLSGVPHVYTGCPLNQDLRRVTPEAIASPDFHLIDRDGRTYDFNKDIPELGPEDLGLA